MKRPLCLRSLGLVILMGCAAVDPGDGAPPAVAYSHLCATASFTGAQLDGYELALDRIAPDATTPERQAGSIVVPVHAHVLTDGAHGKLDGATLEKQIDVLNAAYSGKLGGHDTAFRFALATVDETTDAAWYTVTPKSKEEAAMKQALRKGGPGDLNLYFAALGDGLLGWSTYPQHYTSAPLMDGVVLLTDTVPGGAAAPYNLGMTAVHEVGHWLGLYHTFQGGCSSPNDGVKDTPREAQPTFGCPKEVPDTCPNEPGTGTTPRPDPIHDSMDYTDDDCQIGLTAGQSRKMNRSWKYRAVVAGSCGDGTVDADETCDTGIPGSCPTSCGDACHTSTLENGGTCQATCTAPQPVPPKNGDGCCVGDSTPDNDSDCAPAASCGNGKLDPGEACDTAIAAGQPGACPTSCDDGNACTADALVGKDCQAKCEHTPITVPAPGDGCCPPGANAGSDGDCAASCGDGVLTPPEICDTGIAAGAAGACPTSCPDDGDACTVEALVDAGTCNAHCASTKITAPANGDGCCPPGATSANDDDCAPPVPTAFRIDSMALRDPHIYLQIFGTCHDLTEDYDHLGLSVNSLLAKQINGDADGDGYLDLSPTVVMKPLAEHAATTAVDFVFARCSAKDGSCAGTTTRFAGTASSRASGTCLGVADGTTSSYTPPIDETAGGACFASEPEMLAVSLQGVTINLYDAQLAAVYVADPATGLTKGLIRGFLRKDEAEATIVNLPLLGMQKLSDLLPGGGGVADTCAGHSDLDQLDGKDGWYFYMNYTAVAAAYTD